MKKGMKKESGLFGRGIRKVVPVLLILTLLIIAVVFPVMAKSPGPQVAAVQVSPRVVVTSDTTPSAPLPFAEMAVGGFGIVWFVTGMVSWIKKMGVKGNWLTLASMVIGLVFGIAFQYYLTPLTTYILWFVAILYGLFLGFIACGVYDAYGNKASDPTPVTTPPSIPPAV